MKGECASTADFGARVRHKSIDTARRRLQRCDVIAVSAPSPAARARRPLVAPVLALLLLALAVVVAGAGIELLALWVLDAPVAPSLHVAVFFVAFDLATGGVLLAAVARRLALHRAAPVDADPPPISVLIAAYNEAGGGDHGVVATVRAVAAETGVTMEILVGDDGSEDGTYQELVSAFGLEREGSDAHVSAGHVLPGGVPVRVFRFPHAGKGATLNALAAHASHEVLVTMDADTSPGRDALARLASAFLDPAVESAAGVVSVRNARSVLTRHQYAEYVKNSIVRIGWSALGALEQVPGAFAGVRRDAFRAVGGFPVDSLTEDYELTYRLVARGRTLGRVPVVVTVLEAQAFTDVPPTVRGFVRQRTRWFAGFLSTLYRFKHLIGRPGAGGFGVVRLPLKLVDAVLPILAFTSLLVLVRGVASSSVSLSRVAVGIFLVRWLWDLFFYGVAVRFSRRLGDRDYTRRVAPEGWRGWLYTATEALTYVWLKHASTLRAYSWAVRRVRTWEPSRDRALVLEERPSHAPPNGVGSMVGSRQCAPPSVP
jgi:cellulose synthase/poly-beta-1,6-N-acetylglucosamine synthase-like glycosyltransferase